MPERDEGFIKRYANACHVQDYVAIEELLRDPVAKRQPATFWASCMHSALSLDDPKMGELLVAFGVDVNVPQNEYEDWGILFSAANNAKIRMAKWLLENGARVNFVQRNGATSRDFVEYCPALAVAAQNGNIEIAKLLLEHGADVNAVRINQSPLSWAITFKHDKMAEFLRSQGGKLPSEIPGGIRSHDPILLSVRTNVNTPSSTYLKSEDERAGPEIHFADKLIDEVEYWFIFTVGMSDRPMNVPPGQDQWRHAELVLRVPTEWKVPVFGPGFRQTANYWVIEWMQRLARYPFENNTWLGGSSAIIANGDPPQPLAEGVRQTCWLLLADFGDLFRRVRIDENKEVVFYHLMPIFTSERDFERQHGLEALIRRFRDAEIGMRVDLDRKPVV